MPNYIYKACTDAGQEIRGKMDADSIPMVEDALRRDGYTPLSVKEKKGIDFGSLFSGVKEDDIIIFTRQLRSLLLAGVPILRALDVIIEQTEPPKLKIALRDVYRDIESGTDFSVALHKFPKFFSEIYQGTIQAGEKGGVLPESLDQLAEYLEYEMSVKRDITAALRYPVIVLLGIVVAAGVFSVFVIPKFAAVFDSYQVQLPWASRVVFAASTYAKENYPLVGLIIVFFIMIFRIKIQTKSGRLMWDRFKLRVPIFGILLQKVVFLRFSRMMNMMYKSGLSVVQSLRIVSKTLNNSFYARELESVIEKVKAGETLSSCLQDSSYFPPMVVYMIATGEKSGSLDRMLEELARHYDLDLKYRIRNLTVLIEPIVTIVLGVGVLILALAVFLPMWDLVKVVRQ